MTMTSGQSMFGFFGRTAGTFLAMVFSIVIWYIVDLKTAGAIVILWFFIFMEMYCFLKFPKFISIWLITIVTQVLIIGTFVSACGNSNRLYLTPLGYELQVRKLGLKAASARSVLLPPCVSLC